MRPARSPPRSLPSTRGGFSRRATRNNYAAKGDADTTHIQRALRAAECILTRCRRMTRCGEVLSEGMISSLPPSSRESTLLNLLNFHPICIFLEALGFFVGAFFCLRILLFLFLENWEERGERKGSVSREGSRRLELSSSRSNGYDKMGNVIWK